MICSSMPAFNNMGGMKQNAALPQNSKPPTIAFNLSMLMRLRGSMGGLTSMSDISNNTEAGDDDAFSDSIEVVDVLETILLLWFPRLSFVSVLLPKPLLALSNIMDKTANPQMKPD